MSLSYGAAMDRDRRLDAVARALDAELFFRRHGTMPAPERDMTEATLARALARVALLAADGDVAALDRLRRDRAEAIARLFADDAPGRPALAVTVDYA